MSEGWASSPRHVPACRDRLPGTPHHVTQRGNRRLPVFFGDDDRREYLQLLGSAMQASGNILRRYVHGVDGVADDPLAWYEGAGFSDANERFLRTDERGSIVVVSEAYTVLAVNRYDEYGIPQSTNQGRFQYTGQAWLPELGMYHYKARIYSPTLGRFLQTDPIGYKDQMNLYAYVGNDPVNGVDPDGMCTGSLIADKSDGGCKTGGFVAGSGSSLGGGPSQRDIANANSSQGGSAAAGASRGDAYLASTTSDNSRQAGESSISSGPEWSQISQVVQLKGGLIVPAPYVSVRGYRQIMLTSKFASYPNGLNRSPLLNLLSTYLKNTAQSYAYYFRQRDYGFPISSGTIIGLNGSINNKYIDVPLGANFIQLSPTVLTSNVSVIVFGR